MDRTPNYQRTDKFRNSGYYKLFLCCLMTLVVMYAHRYLPEKTLTLVPVPDQMAFLYMDESPSGKSSVEWLDEPAMSWRCTVVADGPDYTCGFHVPIGGGQGSKGLDLSGYDAVRVHLEYTGDDRRLTIYIRNFEPGFSTKYVETAKFNHVSISTQFVNKPVQLQMTEFSVADWWIQEMEVPRELSQPNFSNAIALGVDLSHPAPPGQHDFKLKQLEFVGLWVSAESWYMGILLFWIFAIFIGGGTKLAMLRRSVRTERLRLENLANYNDVLAAQSDRYKHLSMMDHLTGMLNRQGISDYIDKKFPSGSERPVSLVMVDVDHFKSVNDTLGHDAGDQILRKVAAIITSNTRQSDCAGRWGGEEFIVLLPYNSVEDAYQMAEKLRHKISQYRFEEFPDLTITVSCGVGAQMGDRPFEDLFRRTDVALYQAKANGRNCTVIAPE